MKTSQDDSDHCSGTVFSTGSFLWRDVTPFLTPFLRNAVGHTCQLGSIVWPTGHTFMSAFFRIRAIATGLTLRHKPPAAAFSSRSAGCSVSRSFEKGDNFVPVAPGLCLVDEVLKRCTRAS